MNKDSYIETLKSILEGMTSSVNAQKIIEYYEQYFDDAFDLGRKAEDIIEELGDPSELACEVLAGMQLKAFELFSSSENVRMMDVSLLDIRVHLVFSERQEVSVTYQGYEEYNPDLLKVEYKTNHLRITQKASRIMTWQTMNVKGQKPYLLIELPQSYKGKLLIRTRDSRIIVDGKYAETKVHFHLYSKNAKIECNELFCKDIEAITETGRIKISHCQAKTMTLETRTERIEVEKSQITYLQAKSLEGRIIVSKNRIELAELENVEGRIINNDSLIDDCRMQNEDGRIYYILVGNNDGLHLDLLSRQGKVTINDEKLPKGILAVKDLKPKKKEKRYFNVYARTSTGKIEIMH